VHCPKHAKNATCSGRVVMSGGGVPSSAAAQVEVSALKYCIATVISSWCVRACVCGGGEGVVLFLL